MHHKKQSTKDMMQALLGVPTYYDMLEECEMKLVGLCVGVGVSVSGRGLAMTR